LLPELRAKYDGQFVAIKDGKVVASGSERVAVALEAYSRVGYGPLYLGHVTDSPPAAGQNSITLPRETAQKHQIVGPRRRYAGRETY
jgi:hypothetical protein